MLAELHCHSHYSRGKKITWEAFMSPRDIIKTARQKGIFGVAITDHNDSRSWKEAKRAARDYGILFIPGIEIGTRSGHIIGLGLNEHIKSGQTLEDTIDKIHQQAGLVVAPHPFDLRSEGVMDEVIHVDAVEVFNSLNLDRLSNKLALSKADEYCKPKVVGSDSHNENMFGSALNEMDAHDLDGVLKEIKAGRVEFQTKYIPMPVIMDWARDRFANSYMDVMKYINDNYSSPKAWVAKNMLNRFVLNRTKYWDGVWGLMANFGLGMSVLYGGLRYIAHY